MDNGDGIKHVYRENDVVCFRNSDDEVYIGFLRPLALYPKRIGRKVVIVDEISTFQEYQVPMEKIEKFSSTSDTIYPALHDRAIECAAVIQVLHRREEIQHGIVLHANEKNRRGMVKKKTFNPKDGYRYVERSIGYLRYENTESIPPMITLDEEESFHIREDVLYYGNSALFVGKLSGCDKGSSTVTLTDSFTKVSRRVAMPSIMKLTYLPNLRRVLNFDEVQYASFSRYVHDLIGEVLSTFGTLSLFRNKEILLQGSIVCAETVRLESGMTVLPGERLRRGYTVCKLPPCYVPGQPYRCFKTGLPTRRHRLRQHKEFFTKLCASCGKRFDNASSLTSHRLRCPRDFWKHVAREPRNEDENDGYDIEYLEAMQPFVRDEQREQRKKWFLRTQRGIYV